MFNLDEYFSIHKNVGELQLGEGGYAAFFDTICAALEGIIGFDDTRSVYIMRHCLTFLIYFFSVIVFYFFLKNFFNSQIYAIAGSMFYFLHPRLFSHGFFNLKDSIAMSLVALFLLPTLFMHNSGKYKHCLFAGIISGLAITARIPLVFLPLLVVSLMLFASFQQNSSIVIKRTLFNSFIFISLVIISTYAFWPIIWESPLDSLKNIFFNMKNHKWDGNNFFFGAYIKPTNLPWYYLPTWIAITTPISYLILFLIGVFYNVKNTFSKLNGKKIFEQFMLTGFFAPLIIIIVSNATLYDGWRHTFFVYPFMCFIMTQGFIYFSKILYPRRKNHKYLFEAIILLTILLGPIYQIVKLHPNQQVYFNLLVGSDPMQNFEGDYWGLSNKQGLEWIVDNDKRDIITIVTLNSVPSSKNRHILKTEDRIRLRFIKRDVGTPFSEINGDYYMTNFRGDFDGYKEMQKGISFPYNACVHSVKVGDMTIMGVYDLNKKL